MFHDANKPFLVKLGVEDITSTRRVRQQLADGGFRHLAVGTSPASSVILGQLLLKSFDNLKIEKRSP